MLIFGNGLRIMFWDVRSQRREGIIKHKSNVEEDTYVVSICEIEDEYAERLTKKICTVHYDQITHVLIKDFVDDHKIWVGIDDLYTAFLNGETINWYTRYHKNLPVVRYQQLSKESLKYAIHDEEVAKITRLEWKLTPKKVIFHGPATIVMWQDGTKTVVKKTENDTDDREKAVMFAILKKVCGSRGNMNRYLKSFKEVESNEEKKEEAGSSELCQCEQGAGESSSESTV